MAFECVAVWVRRRRLRLRRAVSIGILFSLLSVVACSAATARIESKVRVLLYSGTGPIQIGRVAAPMNVELDSRGELIVGQRPQARRWAPTGPGPWRVGSRIVRGEIVVRVRSGRIEVLNRIGLEDYVASTVGGEMSPSWPTEALRAQAVATRTYVLYQARRRHDQPWDVRATAVSQLYRGVEAETSETLSAARATAGKILTYRGEPILAVFHSTAGGRTATAAEVWGEDLPYLRVVEVENEDDAPHTYWRTAFARDVLTETLDAAGFAVGDLKALSVDARTSSGRVESLTATGASGTKRLQGRGLRDLVNELALRSTLFEIREVGDEFVFVGSGFGHGVGMSQWGARAMARQGASYGRILARFYPGTRLEKRNSDRIAVRGPLRAGKGGRE